MPVRSVTASRLSFATFRSLRSSEASLRRRAVGGLRRLAMGTAFHLHDSLLQIYGVSHPVRVGKHFSEPVRLPSTSSGIAFHLQGGAAKFVWCNPCVASTFVPWTT